MMNECHIEELKRIMNTIDGRDFLYNFFLDSCGFDLELGVPSNEKDAFEQGVKKPAIDFFNLLVYHCNENFKIMLLEQKQRRANNGRRNCD